MPEHLKPGLPGSPASKVAGPTVFLLVAGLLAPAVAAAAPTRPNVVLIMADDMGYTDIGCYGGEIETPSLDRPAAGGLRLTQFYNTGRCCPTRSSLLTGLYAHQVGMGWMTRVDMGRPPYAGELSPNTVGWNWRQSTARGPGRGSAK